MTTLEKIAYLKGIIAASNISDSQTKRIYEAMVDVLDSIAEDVEFNADNIDNIDSRLSEVDEDLDVVESIVLDDELFDYAEDDERDDDDFIDDADDFEDYEDEADEDDDFIDDADEEESIPFEEPAAADEAPLPAQEAPDDDAQEDDFEDDEEEDGEEMYEIECPACHETIYLQESVILEGEVDCPNCGEPLEFDIEFEEE